jgi:hypothetical protein
MNINNKIFIILISIFLVVNVDGQDSINKSINITSSFKPVLKPVLKLGFNASFPNGDSSKPRLVYNIPVQQIYPGLTLVIIKPMAFNPDSMVHWPSANYFKVGYGNLKTPFLATAISLLAGKSNIIFSGNHVGSKGKLANQEYSQTSFDAFLNAPIAQNVMLDTRIALHQDKYYQYGFNHNLYNLYSENDLLRQYYNISTSASIRNTKPTVYGLTYHPKIAFDFFRDNLKNNETNATVDLPFEKFIGNTFGLKLGVNADINNYQSFGNKTTQNFIFTVPVGLLVRTPIFNVKLGMSPSWNNSDYKLLPDIVLEFPVAEEKWIIQAGWISYFNKASFHQLTTINPYINIPKQLLNNRITERYLGFKGTLLNHFSYSTKIGYTEFVNMPLFVNDTISGKSFNVVFEEQLKAIQLHGEFGIIEAERFSMTAKFNWFIFNNLVTTQKAWGLVPMELSTHLRWNVLQSLWFTSDLYAKDGSLYRNKDGSSGRTPAAFDLNAGLEFNIAKNLLIWGQFNNLFNASYQCWNQYNNYGFNATGGIIIKFNKN